MMYAKLMMVAVSDGKTKGKPEQSNKFYEMEWDEKSSTFNVKYGRVESTVQTASYPSYMWDTKYNEKIRKGYKDVTHTVVKEVSVKKSKEKLLEIDEKAVEKFLTLMKKYTDGLVAKTYTVKATSVTQKQINNAQSFINQLIKIPKSKKDEVNNLLMELYMEIPRYMDNVKNYLLPNINLKDTLQQEQDNLDAMASQVALENPKKEVKNSSVTKTLLDILGITMTELKSFPSEIEYINKQLKKGGERVKSIFQINKSEHTSTFNKWLSKQSNKSTKLLLHGTRCSSVVPIIEQGLKIRPVGNYQFSGKAYGDGNYFSEVCDKSLGYTGYDNDRVLLVYEVHTGNPYVYKGWFKGNAFNLNYKELSKRGFDSTHVKAGNGLLNEEIIAYNEDQCHIKYIIHL